MGLLGAHVSTSGGICNAITNGEKLKCDAIQIFTKSQMRWDAKPLKDKDVAKFKEMWAVSRIKKIIVHDSYLINLGSPDQEKHRKSESAFIDEIKRAKEIGANFLVFHPGAHMGEGESKCIKRIGNTLNEILEEIDPGDVTILIETTAGQGTNVGYRFEHLRDILAILKSPGKFGICIDTCHIFASGYDIRTKNAYENVMREFDNSIGTNKIFAFHLNDAKVELGSRVDRHENIGVGKIGKDAFGFIVNDKRFSSVPMVLETPGGDEFYKKNLEILRGLIR
ncbi:MAG: deoxyribonuclease IV [Proteobacteria bacterium]|nr:deoxyribonuclease IV [Pseudomonadota bacterium]